VFKVNTKQIHSLTYYCVPVNVSVCYSPYLMEVVASWCWCDLAGV